MLTSTNPELLNLVLGYILKDANDELLKGDVPTSLLPIVARFVLDRPYALKKARRFARQIIEDKKPQSIQDVKDFLFGAKDLSLYRETLDSFSKCDDGRYEISIDLTNVLKGDIKEHYKARICAMEKGWTKLNHSILDEMQQYIRRDLTNEEREDVKVFLRTGKTSDRLGQITQVSSETQRAEWKPGYQSNLTPVQNFLANCCTFKKDNAVEKELIYQAFLQFCDQNGTKHHHRANFFKMLMDEVRKQDHLVHDYRPILSDKSRPYMLMGLSIDPVDLQEWKPGEGKVCVAVNCEVCGEGYDPSKPRYKGKRRGVCSTHCSNIAEDNELIQKIALEQVSGGIEEGLLYSVLRQKHTTRYWGEAKIEGQLQKMLDEGSITRRTAKGGKNYFFLTSMSDEDIIKVLGYSYKDYNKDNLGQAIQAAQKEIQAVQKEMKEAPMNNKIPSMLPDNHALNSPPPRTSPPSSNTKLDALNGLLDNIEPDILVMYQEARKKCKLHAGNIEMMKRALAEEESNLEKAMDDLATMKIEVMKEMNI